MDTKKDLEKTCDFNPQFNTEGLIPCIVTSSKTKDVLMFAFMNELAISKTLSTGEAHYWSRSRNELWHKGATSGNIQKVIELRTDCDQDCLWMSVEMKQPEISCHTNRNGCFYRKLDAKSGQLSFIASDQWPWWSCCSCWRNSCSLWTPKYKTRLTDIKIVAATRILLALFFRGLQGSWLHPVWWQHAVCLL